MPYVDNLAPKWYELGVMLLEEKQEKHLTLVQTNYGGDARKCCLAVLQYWMDVHPEATWDQLVIALRSPGVELVHVASDIENNFSGKNSVAKYY